MTVASTYSPPQYTGNGTTTIFAFPFQFFTPSDLVPLLYDTVALANVSPEPVLNGSNTYDFTVTGTQDAATGEYLTGANVVFNNPLPGNYQLTIQRNVQPVQNVSLAALAPFPAKTVEAALDRLTMLVQQFYAAIKYCITAPAFDTSAPSALPSAAARANQVLGFDATGENLVAVPLTTTAAAPATTAPAGLSATGAVGSSSNYARQDHVHPATAPTKSQGDNSTNVATTAYVDTGLAAAISTAEGVAESVAAAAVATWSPALAGVRQKIRVLVTGSSTVAVSASSLMLATAAGVIVPVLNLSVTASTSSTGLNGLDTGSVAASTWYNVWAVSNGTTSGVVLSLSGTAPNAAITATYPGYLWLGVVRTNASSLLLATSKVGRTNRYILGGPNVAALPQLASGGTSGGLLSAISVSSFVPPSAIKIALTLNYNGTGGGGGTYAAVAPNGNYTASAYSGSPLSLGNSNLAQAGSITGDMMLESTNIYYGSDLGATGLVCLGWEDEV